MLSSYRNRFCVLARFAAPLEASLPRAARSRRGPESLRGHGARHPPGPVRPEDALCRLLQAEGGPEAEVASGLLARDGVGPEVGLRLRGACVTCATLQHKLDAQKTILLTY